MKNEVWRTYPEFYFIQGSSLGRVRTFDRVVKNKNGMRLVKGRILPQRRNRNGYLRVGFGVDGKLVNRSVHRIVASCFLPNPSQLPEVNHKNGDRTDNNVINLEWCTPEYNIEYREKHGVALNRPVFAINLSTLEVSSFRSQHEASRELGIANESINMVIKGKRKTAGNYWFTNANNNAVENIRAKFGNELANRIDRLM